MLTAGALLGILLIVSGVALALASALDLLWGGLGLLLTAAGAALSLYCYRRSGAKAVAEVREGERSEQLPLPEKPKSREAITGRRNI
jgi:hypothetical protein